MRPEKVSGGPECSASGGGFGFRQRLDGGYNVSMLSPTIVDIVPDSFRLLRDFVPLAGVKRREFRPRIGRRFVEEWRTKRRWSLDAASPFERVRVPYPAPAPPALDTAGAHLAAA